MKEKIICEGCKKDISELNYVRKINDKLYCNMCDPSDNFRPELLNLILKHKGMDLFDKVCDLIKKIKGEK